MVEMERLVIANSSTCSDVEKKNSIVLFYSFYLLREVCWQSFLSDLNGFTKDCAFSFNIIAFSYFVHFIILVGYLNMQYK